MNEFYLFIVRVIRYSMAAILKRGVVFLLPVPEYGSVATPQQCVVVSERAGTVHLRDQPMDVSQPAETKRRQNRTDVGWHQVHHRQSSAQLRPESDDRL